MGQALYRKYRSKSLDEVVGQKHITDTLSKALKRGRISHAYLFTGPRGVGKTSVARILAHEINQLPYDESQNHIDIIEIDAASNRRIDEIRDLRDKVYIAPAQAKYKVYIIDEVHMLTREAFNALLKTLEEPPAHAVFILATTEAHKLPATIISRTQRFVFRPIDAKQAVAHLRTIARKEKIDISDEALELIVQHADGSLRDSSSLLDQAAGQNTHIDELTVRSMLGIPPDEAIDALLATATMADGPGPLLTGLNALYDQGFQAAAIAKQLARTLRQQLVAQSLALSPQKTLSLLADLLEVPVSHNPERYLEITLLKLLESAAAVPLATEQVSEARSEPAPSRKTQSLPAAPSVATAAKTTAPEKKQPTPSKPVAKDGALDEAVWDQVLASLKSHHNTLYGIIRMAKPDFSEAGKLNLTFAFAFHQKRMNEAKNQQLVRDALQTLTGTTVEITCSLDPHLKLASKKSALTDLPEVPAVGQSPDGSLATISNIFGGGELLQS